MEREPLLPGLSRSPSASRLEPPVQRLAFYWPCLFTGVVLNTAAVCASVWLSKSILDDPTRAAYVQKNWWIVWLVLLLVVLAALPVYLFTAVVMMFARSALGPHAAFPSWAVLVSLSVANGSVFYGLFNATYPFSFFLQVQVYSVFTAFSLCAYAPVAFATQCVPYCGFNNFAAWLCCAATSIAVYVHMEDAFAWLGYSLSRTPGAGLWHPWVALVLVLLFISMGAIENVHSIAAAARFFEPETRPRY